MNRPNLNGIGMTSQRTRERLIARLAEQGIENRAVLDVMRSTPLQRFLDEALSHRAYEDVALPIGHGQTISQPFVVARMTESVMPEDGSRPGRVLDVGTGCGYQAAILAQLADEVFSIERVRPLLDKAREYAQTLGLKNIRFRHGDGTQGWPEQAPFDAIVVAAAPQQVPDALLDQLADGGRLVIPVGDGGVQELRRYTRRGDQFDSELLTAVRFVPLYSGALQD